MLPLTDQGPSADPQPRCHLRDIGLGFSRFARRYFGNHSLFSFPQGTEMFHFPWFALRDLFIQSRVTGLFTQPGFPIRTSPDQRSVGNSPELFAATHVLHRLLAPRHPPHALSSLLTSISRTPSFRLSAVSGPGRLETKVQASALRGRPERVIFFVWLTSHDAFQTEIPQQKLNSTLRMQFSKNARLNRRGSGYNPLLLDAISSKLVELIGFEPTTSGLQSRRSPS